MRMSAGGNDAVTNAAVKAIKAAQQEERLEAIRAKKLAKKAAFDSEYDEGGARAVKDSTLDEDAEEEGSEGDANKKSDGNQKTKGKGWARCAVAADEHVCTLGLL
jgi:hypothetical protein